MPGEARPDETTVGRLLHRFRNGDEAALNLVFSRLYEDLRRLAGGMLRNKPVAVNQGLNGTALINAACEKLLEQSSLEPEDKKHFFRLFARGMRDVLVDSARAAQAIKRGGRLQRITFDDVEEQNTRSSFDIIGLNEALEELFQHDPEGAQVASLRFYAGRTLEETAELMGCSFSETRRHWEYARAWLKDRLARGKE